MFDKIPKPKKTAQRGFSGYLRWSIFVSFLLGTTFTGCTCGTPPLNISATFETPTSGAVFRSSDDEDPGKDGFQLTVKVKVEGAPQGSTVVLLNNAKELATKEIAEATTLTFEKLTVPEGANVLTLTVTPPEGKGDAFTSDPHKFFIDASCYKIQFIDPKAGGLYGMKDDVDSNKDGLQKDVTISIYPSPAIGEQVELIIKAGDSTESVKITPSSTNAEFKAITLPNGKVSLTARIQDSAGNTCEDQIDVNVKTTAPTAKIERPSGKLCPGEDKDPNKDGFQAEIVVLTNAEDGSSAQILVDGQIVSQPVLVAGGRAIFSSVDLLGAPDAFEATLSAKVTDTSGNVGTSPDVKIQVRSKGYALSFKGLIDGQNLPLSRDTDPNTPGFQFTIQLQTSAPDETEVTLDLNGTKFTSKAQNATVSFDVELAEGENTIKATVSEPVCKNVTNTPTLKITTDVPGFPSLSCALLKGTTFDNNGEASINGNDDTNTQSAGVQNGVRCESDAEAGQTLSLNFNGTAVTPAQTLVDGGNQLRNATYSDLTLKEGENTLELSVTNKAGKLLKKTYKINLDTQPPKAIQGLQLTVTKHRQVSVKLFWQTPDDGNNVAPKEYEIRWSSLLTTITEQEWSKPEGKQTSLALKKVGETEEVLITGLDITKTYVFAVRARDKSGNLSAISNLVTKTLDFQGEQVTETNPQGGQYGFKIQHLGDLDKDGFPDIIVCKVDATISGKSSIGAGYIYYGRNPQSGTYLPSSGAPDVTITGDAAGDSFCHTAVSMGDLNGDGYADFAVSSTKADSGKGKVYIIFGGTRGTIKDGTATSNSRVIITGQSGKFFAWYLESAGVNGTPDINGDGKADLLVSSFGNDVGTTHKGSVFVFYSRTSYPTSTTTPLVLTMGTANFADMQFDNDVDGQLPLFGTTLIAADLDQDKNVDILITSSLANKAYLFYGPIKPTNGVVKASLANVTFTGPAGETSAQFGSSASVLGDVDKDGKLDLMISASQSAPNVGRTRAGRVFLYSGTKLVKGATLATTDAAVTFFGSGKDNLLNISTAAGDINKDGYADFLISEGRASDGTKSRCGGVYLYFGKPFANFTSGDAKLNADFKWFGQTSDALLGFYSLLGGFDMNGDGYPDILFAESPTLAPSSQTQKAGSLYIKH